MRAVRRDPEDALLRPLAWAAAALHSSDVTASYRALMHRLDPLDGNGQGQALAVRDRRDVGTGPVVRLAQAFFREGLSLRAHGLRRREQPLLSRREWECLVLCAGGLSTKQIGDRLQLSDATVRSICC